MRSFDTANTTEPAANRGGQDFFFLMDHEARTITFGGPVGENFGPLFAAALRILDEQTSEIIDPVTGEKTANSYEPITIHMTSPGGSVMQGLQLIDAMEETKSPIKVVGSGLIASMAVPILAAADEEYLTPSTQVMFHRPALRGAGMLNHNADDMRNEAELLERLEDRICGILARKNANRSSWTAADWHDFMVNNNSDRWLTAEEAVALGLADGLTTPDMFALTADEQRAIASARAERRALPESGLIEAA